MFYGSSPTAVAQQLRCCTAGPKDASLTPAVVVAFEMEGKSENACLSRFQCMLNDAQVVKNNREPSTTAHLIGQITNGTTSSSFQFFHIACIHQVCRTYFVSCAAFGGNQDSQDTVSGNLGVTGKTLIHFKAYNLRIKS